MLESAAQRGVDLLLMGDLFLAWFGPERFWPPHHRPIMAALRHVRAGGGRVRMIVGNRDYLCRPLIGDVFDEIIEHPRLITLAGRPTWVLHGDGIDPSDRAYRAWRTLTRSRLASAVAERLPSAWGRALPVWAERKLASTNRAHKTGRLPMDAIATVARTASAAGAERCLMGHFHRHEELRFNDVTVVIAPGWQEHHAVLVAESDGRLRLMSLSAEAAS